MEEIITKKYTPAFFSLYMKILKYMIDENSKLKYSIMIKLSQILIGRPTLTGTHY